MNSKDRKVLCFFFLRFSNCSGRAPESSGPSGSYFIYSFLIAFEWSWERNPFASIAGPASCLNGLPNHLWYDVSRLKVIESYRSLVMGKYSCKKWIWFRWYPGTNRFVVAEAENWLWDLQFYFVSTKICRTLHDPFEKDLNCKMSNEEFFNLLFFLNCIFPFPLPLQRNKLQ